MQRFKSLILLGIFALPICTTLATYRLDIAPRDAQDTSEIILNTTVTFKVTGYEKREDTETETQVPIDKIWWTFDKEILTKVNSTATSITLKATKSGACKLTAIGMVKNQNCTKAITILVKDTEKE